MSYSLNASGHCPDAETETSLHAELAEVLAKPEYGCGSSYFGGSHVNGTLHLHKAEGTEHVHETDEAATEDVESEPDPADIAD